MVNAWSGRHGDKLGDARVALLPLVGRAHHGPGHGVIVLARDEKQRPPLGVVGVDGVICRRRFACSDRLAVRTR
jgi:hypothetical protein